ncbi:MAG: alpha/beta hydrolase [Verrucomicrobiales bacterium]|nr:alpha/beta hydrolase [Verrucomicrobiales bacterium]
MKVVKFLLKAIALFLLLVLGTVTFVWWYISPAVIDQGRVVYTQRHGKDLSFEVFHPAEQDERKHLGIILLNSGSWKSNPERDRLAIISPLIRRGYSVFILSHLSQPEASVMEIVEDVNRAVRTIRHHAEGYGIDPSRIGVTGGSSGGHLALMLATKGGAGELDVPDPIGRESSAVQAVAVFFPVTDLLNLGDSTENLGNGGPPKSFVKGFRSDAKEIEKWKVIGRAMSPIYHVSSDLPPVLIHHGDADTLVPLDQSQRFQKAAESKMARVTLVVRKGKKHGWVTMFIDIFQFADWFDENL